VKASTWGERVFGVDRRVEVGLEINGAVYDSGWL